MSSKTTTYAALFLRLVAAAILLQTLYFKFSAAPESVYIFSKLGVEPFGRIFAGTSELVASALLLIPATQALGALMAMGIMAGAIATHVAVLGIVVQDDGGLLFTLAWIVLLASAGVAWLQCESVKGWIRYATQKL